ncbi:hypothetical protein DRE_00224 [Drechslerella stenobrocha 248]|uniref:C2H2-type domain-containing protein n=1 Tax=Drechslerella stenobrocha 248 TaxID=1043628 RepID=W7HZH8_9PEZI|nr:hypothetical protein DRE_00224 [Drechslerella stenobrocha 248]
MYHVMDNIVLLKTFGTDFGTNDHVAPQFGLRDDIFGDQADAFIKSEPIVGDDDNGAFRIKSESRSPESHLDISDAGEFKPEYDEDLPEAYLRHPPSMFPTTTEPSNFIPSSYDFADINTSFPPPIRIQSGQLTVTATTISAPSNPFGSSQNPSRRKSEKWLCEIGHCGRRFSNKRIYEQHLSKDHRYKSATCQVCGKSLGRKDYMRDHIRSQRHQGALKRSTRVLHAKPT